MQSLFASNFTTYEVAGDLDFPESAEPGALKFVCEESEEELSAFFRSRDIPYDPGLVKDRGGQKCHIWYEPTLPGFRAHTENDPIQGLMFDVDTLSFLSGRTEVVGDALDMVKEMLPHMPRPLDITLGVNHALETVWYEEALKLNFKDLRHSVKFHETTSTVSNHWTQDYIKSGSVDDESYIMVPRRLLEGSAEYGENFRIFLDDLIEGSFVRSKLSWEG
ncbi:MAG: hypothetical protein ABIJ42_05425, partial [Acidobacteriota bacterium]